MGCQPKVIIVKNLLLKLVQEPIIIIIIIDIRFIETANLDLLKQQT